MNTQLDQFSTPPTKTGGQLDYFLLDGSGSMNDKWWDVMASLDAYVATLRGNKINSRVVLTTFDTTSLDLIQRDVNADAWQSLMQNPVGNYGGSTPLYDAINIMCRHLRDWMPERATIVIATDGEENASRFTDETQARALLDWCRAHGWQVIFLGVGFNNSRMAEVLGATPEQSLPVNTKKLLTATEKLGKKRANYGLYGTDINFTKDEKNEFGGFLEGPAK